MQAESDVVRLQRELDEIRLRMHQLLERRLLAPFSSAEQDEYDRLGERERHALRALGRGPTPPEDGEDGRGGQPS
jgi:hypothetical protein